MSTCTTWGASAIHQSRADWTHTLRVQFHSWKLVWSDQNLQVWPHPARWWAESCPPATVALSTGGTTQLGPTYAAIPQQKGWALHRASRSFVQVFGARVCCKSPCAHCWGHKCDLCVWHDRALFSTTSPQLWCQKSRRLFAIHQDLKPLKLSPVMLIPLWCLHKTQILENSKKTHVAVQNKKWSNVSHAWLLQQMSTS